MYVGYLALNKAGVACSYCGGIPFKFNIKKQSFLGLHSCDHMTRKKDRGQGLFVKLNNKSDTLAYELGVDFVFGFPNQNNQPILEKYASWISINQMQVFEIRCSKFPLSSLVHKLGVGSVLFTRMLISRINQYVTEEIISPMSWDGIIRDDSFYSYKSYFENHLIEIKGVKIWFKIKGAVFIGDMEASSQESFNKALDEFKKILKWIGVRKIFFLCTSNSNAFKYFSQSHKASLGNVVGAKILNKAMRIKFEDLRFTLADYDTF